MSYTKVAKPIGVKKIIRGMITGVIIPLTYAKDYLVVSPYTKVSKPISSVYTKVSKPT